MWSPRIHCAHGGDPLGEERGDQLPGLGLSSFVLAGLHIELQAAGGESDEEVRVSMLQSVLEQPESNEHPG